MKLQKSITESMELEEDIAYYHGHNKDSAGQDISDAGMTIMNSFTIPEFIPPYPVRVHSMEAETCKTIREWLLYHSVDKVFDPDKFTKLLHSPEFAARMFPDTSAERLELFSKFLIVTYVVDEIMDDTELERPWETTVSLALEIHKVITSTFPEIQSVTEILDTFSTDWRETIENLFPDEPYNVKDSHPNPCEIDAGKLSPIGSCFRDFWGAAVASMHRESCLRLARFYQKFLIASLIQIQNRENGVIPSLNEYVLIRRDAGASACCLIFVDFNDGVLIPEEIFSSPQMQTMMNIFRDILSWHNDLWSFKKECLLKGDVHNLVFLLSHYLPFSYQRAAQVVTEMLRAQCSELEAVAEELLKATTAVEEHRHTVCRYIEASRRCIGATHAWHNRSLLFK
ncbi:hypothetical protein O6H91_01G062900 [Diphasiastrum complanatum]|uniref:Uncharacterized protein n=1 Tax=Diphasiastrum complanatum TaxID=34168 RepID=A0ACC2ERN2_DIPCM|nr:hypothetical protein O6H91_01G062900 [Diphasiastrum complanatum]